MVEAISVSSYAGGGGAWGGNRGVNEGLPCFSSPWPRYRYLVSHNRLLSHIGPGTRCHEAGLQSAAAESIKVNKVRTRAKDAVRKSI